MTKMKKSTHPFKPSKNLAHKLAGSAGNIDAQNALHGRKPSKAFLSALMAVERLGKSGVRKQKLH